MQEAFLYYVWKHKAFTSKALKTATNQAIVIQQLGQHNHDAGPDFFNAQLRINDQLWAGNVEMHVKSSDWYVHGHEKDKAYDNVILHVVWQHDTEIFRANNSKIPTLELQNYVDKRLLDVYTALMQSKSWINCERHFNTVDNFVLNNWLERLFIERLERKSNAISALLKKSNNDWEAVLFSLLLKNFGLKVNGDAFFSLANSIDFNVIRKLQANVLDLEALLFGQAQLLDDAVEDLYYIDLKKRYAFLKQKFNLNAQGVLPLQFFRLRPQNFPTVRLSQFANLYASEPHLFSKLIDLDTVKAIYELFKKGVSTYWLTHYTFGKTSKATKKKVSQSFIDLLIINTIIPLQFSYAKSKGKTIEDKVFGLMKALQLETNSITTKFLQLRAIEKNALNSQALLQLKQAYCDKNKCLQCAVGNRLIVKN